MKQRRDEDGDGSVSSLRLRLVAAMLSATGELTARCCRGGEPSQSRVDFPTCHGLILLSKW